MCDIVEGEDVVPICNEGKVSSRGNKRPEVEFLFLAAVAIDLENDLARRCAVTVDKTRGHFRAVLAARLSPRKLLPAQLSLMALFCLNMKLPKCCLAHKAAASTPNYW